MSQSRIHPSLTALAEVAIMFLPSIPAYLWLWPNVGGTDLNLPVQSVVYLYLMAGCVLIGGRRWSLEELGMRREGVGVSLACGAVVVAAFTLGRLATDLPLGLRPLTLRRTVLEMLFYFGLVGLVEELLFRGLVYRALYEWRGTRLAILGSSLAFGLFHVGWMGVLGALGVSLIGAIFGVIRWRSRGIVGLIVVHGLLDIIGKEMYPGLTVEQAWQLHIVRPWLAILADLLLLSVVVYLWKAHPWVERMTSAHAGRGGAGR